MGSSAQRYDEVVDFLRESIAGATLKPGDRLPTQRELAEKLQLSQPTVARGYIEAKRLGLVVSTVGRGTFVAEPAERSPVRADLTVNAPSPTVASSVLNADLRTFAREGKLGAITAYARPQTIAACQAAVAAWLQELGVESRSEEIVLCEGAHHGVLLALQVVAPQGSAVICEELTYPGLLAITDLLGLRLVPVPTGENGPQPSDIAKAADETGASVLFLNPTLQNPLGVTLTLEARRAIAALAKRKGMTIIEDDVYRALVQRPVRSLSEFLPEQTIYIGSLSKVLAPGLRLGFVLARSKVSESLRRAGNAHRYSAAAVPLLLAQRWFEAGLHREVAEAHQREIARRITAARRILSLPHLPAAYHVWIAQAGRDAAEAAVMRLARAGVDVPPVNAFSVPQHSAGAKWGIRLALGGLESESHLLDVLETVRDVLADNTSVSAFAV